MKKINFSISGIGLPTYLLISAVLIIAMILGKVPANLVGSLLVLMVLGNAFNMIGNKLPIVRSYLGGGAIFTIFAASALATFHIIPSDIVEVANKFMNNWGFLDLYIASLITGSILGMNRNLLKKASVRFLPVSFISIALAIIAVGGVGALIGYGFADAILYVALPMMSGGMGAGVIPLSGIYAGASGMDQAAIVSRLIPSSALGNVTAIIAAVFIVKIASAKLNGQGKLMPVKNQDAQTATSSSPDYTQMGVGLIVALAFFTLGNIINYFFPQIHAYAFMIVIVVMCKIFGLVPQYYESCAVQWSQFSMKNLTAALLAGIGMTLLDLNVLASALTPQYVILIITSIITVSLSAGIFGKLVGFYAVESAITAGLCTNSMGGTGNIAVLSASDRMDLIPFAQMATRIGGAIILILSSFLVRILM